MKLVNRNVDTITTKALLGHAQRLIIVHDIVFIDVEVGKRERKKRHMLIWLEI